MSRVMTTNEVARELNRSPAWVRAHREMLHGYKLGPKLWSFPRDRIMQLLPPDTVPAPCPDDPPRSAPTNEARGGASDGAKVGNSARSAATPMRRQRNRPRGKSATGFEAVFPEYAKHAH